EVRRPRRPDRHLRPDEGQPRHRSRSWLPLGRSARCSPERLGLRLRRRRAHRRLRQGQALQEEGRQGEACEGEAEVREEEEARAALSQAAQGPSRRIASISWSKPYSNDPCGMPRGFRRRRAIAWYPTTYALRLRRIMRACSLSKPAAVS